MASTLARPALIVVALLVFLSLWLTLWGVPFVRDPYHVCGLSVARSDNYTVEVDAWPPAAYACTVTHRDGSVTRGSDLPWLGWFSVALLFCSILTGVRAWRLRRLALVVVSLLMWGASVVAAFS